MKDYKELSLAIQEIASKVLSENLVEKIIAYGREEFSNKTTPVFIDQVEQSKELLFDQGSSMMLAKYLLNYRGKKVGIVAKPCDTRAIASYLAEGLLKRDQVTIIGIQECPGIAGNSACSECTVRNPVIADYIVEYPNDSTNNDNLAKSEQSTDKFAEMSTAERMNYFQEEFSRCIRCYACREACHVCYCEECFVDSNQPFWVGGSIELNDNLTFHLMRAMHMVGRCIDCGACEMACPEGIDVRALTAHLSRTAEEIYDYQAGLDPEQKTLLTDYKVNDPQPGFLE